MFEFLHSYVSRFVSTNTLLRKYHWSGQQHVWECFLDCQLRHVSILLLKMKRLKRPAAQRPPAELPQVFEQRHTGRVWSYENITEAVRSWARGSGEKPVEIAGIVRLPALRTRSRSQGSTIWHRLWLRLRHLRRLFECWEALDNRRFFEQVVSNDE